MKISKEILVVILMLIGISTGQCWAQSQVRGRVVADSVSVAGINIVNLVTKQTTTTDPQGRFSLAANAGDLLVLSAVQFEINRYVIDPADFTRPLLIRMVPKIIELEEAVVNQYSHINAEAMGIIPYGQRKYTPAERKLAAAQSGPVDILVNMFSGRIEMRKKEVEVEKKERLLERLAALYKTEYYVSVLKIGEERIGAFQYFAVEDAKLATAISQRNHVQTTFVLADLARQFLELSAKNE